MGLIRISCFPEISEILAEEVTQLGFPVVKMDYTAIETEGLFTDTYKLNLHLRTANRVLWHLQDFEAADPEQLYQSAKKIDWSSYFTPEDYFSIYSVVKNEQIRDTRFANLKFKDAVADHFMEKFSKRPDSGPERDQVVIFFHWHDQNCSVWLDTSGETIARRGYRKMPYQAPLQETLAAAILKSTSWGEKTVMVDPMCGSGTIAIEAALMAMNKAPGFTRPDFAFKHLSNYNPEYWNQLLKEARNQQQINPAVTIIASDRSGQALKAAKTNAQKAGVDKLISFIQADFDETPIPAETGIVFMNPPYGERMGEVQDLEPLYSRIGDFLKQKCQGYTGYIFTGNLDLAKKIGLRTSSKTKFFNGKLECRLLEYQMYQGTMKTGKKTPEPGKLMSRIKKSEDSD